MVKRDPPIITITANHPVDLSISIPVTIGKRTYQVLCIDHTFPKDGLVSMSATLMERKVWLKQVMESNRKIPKKEV